ncbi:autotransporter [Streptacidiphilus sp. N1-10]|uniref:Autotransporter n=1 Tax=Streptacidiphilus jeojiensis TaxID=3229225 RepID=A0ABV6XZB1_9ACTN
MHRRLLPLAAAVAATVTMTSALSLPAAAQAASGNITAAVLADQDIVLNGDAVVNVPSGTHTYTGVISGQGSLRVSGTGTLVLTKDSTFTLPTAERHQTVAVLGGNHPYTQVSNPDTPAVTVDPGATLQYGTGGTTGLIGAFPYNSPGYQQNQDNIRVDGTLRLSLTRAFNLGTISGSGLVTQPRSMWGTLQICGTNPFSGVIDNGTGTTFAGTTCPAALPDARKVLNQGSWIIDTPLGHTVVERQDFYNRQYGSDINVHSRPGSTVVLTGSYSWADSGPDTDPQLSDPTLNWQPVAHNPNVRGTNIEGATVRWGDGTTHQIFMPGTAQTVYINLHAASGRRSQLTFDYDGPVTLGAPIGGGKYHDTLAAPGQGDIVLADTPGNDVTYTAVQDYDGSTTIEPHATLRLGSGTAGQDSGLYNRSSQDTVIDNGTLVLQNHSTAPALPAITGTGSLTQDGQATTTLSHAVSYTGPTTVAKGTLALNGTTLIHSSGVSLTTAAATLDLREAAAASLRSLTAARGSRIQIKVGGTLTVGGTPVPLTGSQTAIGRTAFAIARSTGAVTLTALGTTATTPSAAPSPSSQALASTTTAAGRSHAAQGTINGDAASSSSFSAAWPLTVLGAAGLCVFALAVVLTTRRGRRRPGRHTR